MRSSLKFEMIGVSMISPEGLAIKPRIPPSCFICAWEPRAPELAIIHTEGSSVWRPSAFLRGGEISVIISSETRSVALDQVADNLIALFALGDQAVGVLLLVDSSTSLRVFRRSRPSRPG